MARYFNFLINFRLFLRICCFWPRNLSSACYAVCCFSLLISHPSRSKQRAALSQLGSTASFTQWKAFFYSSHSRQVLLKSSCWVSFSSTVTVGLDLNVQRCQWYFSLYSLLHKWKLNTVILLNSIIWCLRDCACILMLTRYVWSFHLIKLMSYLTVWLAPKFKYFKKTFHTYYISEGRLPHSQLASQAWI